MTYIYALCDPRDGRVRYVGKSNDPERRLAHHYKPSASQAQSHIPVARWIAKLKRDGLRPVVRTIMQAPDANWQTWERHWIWAFRWAGEELLNITEGGDGGGTTRGQHQSPEHIAKRANAIRGLKRTVEQRAKISRAMTGKRQSASAVAKRAAAQTGVKKPAQSAAMQLHYQQPGSREKTSLASKAMWQNTSIRERIITARTGKKRGPYKKGRPQEGGQ